MSTQAVSSRGLPHGLREDLDQLGRKAAQVAEGTLSQAEFRSFRVPMGIYEQREPGAYMLRCRFPAGALRPAQLRSLAAVARAWGNGVLHVTSRQELQVHGVRLEALHPASLALFQAGISTKGGGGNTVRNIVACSLAGVCPREAMDVTPHAQELTARLLADRLSLELPRKYKIAFSGCAEDCAGATVADLGFVATAQGGVPGFAAYVGGGLGAHSRIGDPLETFVPATEAHAVAESVKRVFDRHGNRRNRNRARLRFLVERLGIGEFRALYTAERVALERERPPAPLVGAPDPRAAASAREGSTRPPTAAATAPRGATAAEAGCCPPWKDGVVTQKGSTLLAVAVPLPLGDITSEKAERLADVGERFGDGILRATQEQNLSLRGVAEAELPSLHAKLAEIGLAIELPPLLRDMTVCAGASTCRLGICLSRGLAQAATETLERSRLDLHRLGAARLHISGCPNACGRHPLAQIGLYGVAKRIGGRLAPHYVLQLGGRLGVGRTRLASGRLALPARAVPAALVDLLSAYLASGEASLDGFLDAHGAQTAETLARRYASVPPFEQDKTAYHDWSAEEPFSLAGRGPGECGAGVFDLIELDLAGAGEALAAGKHHRAATLAARALLVTRGEQPVSDAEALRLFRTLFVDERRVDASLAGVVDEALALADSSQRESALAGREAAVRELVAAVRSLYEGMDASLRFEAPAAAQTATPGDSQGEPESRDFRGVACPLNFVKTKMALERLQPGRTLLVLLSEQGARSVPESVAKEGHRVLSLEPVGDHWRLLVARGPA